MLRIHLCLQDLARMRVLTNRKISDPLARLSIEAEKTAIARAFLFGGARAVLASLHPSIHWVAPVLELAGQADADVELGGKGLLLMPECGISQVVLLGNVIHYPIVRSVESEGRQYFDKPASVFHLRRLLGRTRAEALLYVAREGDPTGTEIGRALEISSATVSEHTAVLRDAGLIVSWRSRNTVRNGVTPLGMALLSAAGQSRTRSIGSLKNISHSIH